MMNPDVFRKMRVKPGTVGRFFFAPDVYHEMIKHQDIIDFEKDHPTFYHLFVESKDQYDARIQDILPLLDQDTRLWISYKKSTSQMKYTINRDSFFILGKRDGIKPFANVSLDDEWSCIGFKKAT